MITTEESLVKWDYNPTGYMEKAGLPHRGCGFFHIQSTGRFWRNSSITCLGLLYQEENTWKKRIWRLPPDSDEYDTLKSFGETVAALTHLIGYNSTSFHVPYLEKKYRAYGLSSPFHGKAHTDLYRELRTTAKALSLSMRLKDLKDFLHLQSQEELEWIAGLFGLYAYRDFMEGGFITDGAASLDDEEFLVTLTPKTPFPAPFTIRHDCFYLKGNGLSAKIKIKVFEDRIRVYYPNIKDYYYLPGEDTAIHKTLAQYVNKAHRIKADRSNCYAYAPYNHSFLNDIPRLEKYVDSLLRYYFSCS